MARRSPKRLLTFRIATAMGMRERVRELTRSGSGERLRCFGSGELAAPRRQSLLRSQARCALLSAATPREGRSAPFAVGGNGPRAWLSADQCSDGPMLSRGLALLRTDPISRADA